MRIWEIVGHIADIVSIVALIISIATLASTRRIRKEMLKHVERSDYREDIDQRIEALSSIQKSLGEKSCSALSLFDEASMILSELQSYYETILPKSILKDIRACCNLVSRAVSPIPTDTIRDVRKRLVGIVAKLKKEKQVL